jgi:hypothetical protein
LPHDFSAVDIHVGRDDGRVELVGLLAARLERALKADAEGAGGGPVTWAEGGRRDVAEPEGYQLALARVHGQAVVDRDLGALLLRVHGPILAVGDVVVDAVLDVRGPVGDAEDPLRVGLVLGEEEVRRPLAVEVSIPQVGIDRLDHAPLRGGDYLVKARAVGSAVPGPLVAEPERGQDVQLRGLGAAVVDADPDEEVLGRGLRVFDEDVEVAALVEHARVEQLVLELLAAPPAARRNEVGVREGGLGVLVQVLHVRVGGRAVEVEVILLDVLPMVALTVGQAEEALLEDRVLAVPQSQGEAEALLVVGDAGEAVLAPAVGAGAGLVVREVVPGVAALAVVFANGPPLPLAEVRPPLRPGSV